MLQFSKKIFLLFACLFILFVLSLTETLGQAGKPITLRYADSLWGHNEASGLVRQFLGNVKFEQGNVTVTCNRAIQYMSANRVVLDGNVVIVQEDLILKAPHIDYDGNTGIADATGGVQIKDNNMFLVADFGKYSTKTRIADFSKKVRIEDDSVIIFSNAIQYHRLTRNSFAFGNVAVKGKYSNVILTGDTVINIPTARFTQSYGKPVLFQIDSTTTTYPNWDSVGNNSLIPREEVRIKYDTLSISADTMEAQRENGETYLFKGKVELFKKGASAKSNNAQYEKTQDIIILPGEPVVWMDSTQLHADSIVISVPQNRISNIHAFRNALTASKTDTSYKDRIDQLIGNEIQIFFQNDSINSIAGYGNAKSLYFGNGTDENSEKGAARNSSDTIFIYFENGEPNIIKWTGGVEGEYFPEIIYERNPKDFYLPTFRWSENKPKKKIINETRR